MSESKEKAMQSIQAMIDAVNSTGADIQLVEEWGHYVAVRSDGRMHSASRTLAGAVCNAFMETFGSMVR